MTFSLRTASLAIAASALALGACGDDDDGDAPADITFDTTTTTTISAAQSVDYQISGLADDQAYRITLVVDANVLVSGDAGTFVDDDSNGAADAGPSENVALITMVNGAPVSDGGAKTVPSGSDDPAAPTGVFPTNGTITLSVTGVGAGTVYPVAYENGGASTFLEINATGTPIEPHAVGGAVSVSSSALAATPGDEQTVASGETVDYSVSGLDSDQAYRITLVVADNVTAEGGMGTFIDEDQNGAADAGASETVALITMVNGMEVADGGAKTVPAGTDDPADPSGIFPSGETINVTVTAVGSGSVYPVLYENGGASTFLEIGDDGVPLETHIIAGPTTVP